MANSKRRNRGRKALVTVLIIVAVLIAVVAVVVKVLRDRVSETFGQRSTDEIKAAVVTVGSISTTISGSGTLSQQETTEVTVPSGVAVQSLLMDAEDTVEAGQKIASVSMSSILTAMNAVQSEIDALDEEIADAAKDTVDTYIRSAVKGRVKEIFCAEGDSVLNVMYEHNALIVLSLDGYLAVDLPAGSLTAGDAVSVTMPDEKTLTGKVDAVNDGTATVLISDDQPRVGDTATVSDADGKPIGSGTLYIHQPLAITGYAGTVSRVNAVENRVVSANGILLTLKDTAFTANYETLLSERAEREETFRELLRLYQAGAIFAPISGKVQSVFESESAENEAETWTLAVLAPQEQMIVTAAVDESDILAVSVGQDASVTISSISDDDFAGKVTSIEKTGASSNGVTSYAVEVTLDRTEKMLPNMSATVSVRIEGVDNALLVPEGAVTKTRDSAYVYTAVDESSGELGGMVEVQVGLSGGGYIEITGGLEEGDTVYYQEAAANDFAQFMNGFGGFGNNAGGMPNQGGTNRPSGSGNGSTRPSGNGNGSGSSRRRNGGD
ncbi:MAG: efflux RND transporter periplasmic adaptor subunit [Clostridia bacterium]|nr:efflux RND transporter periplasmic adaptor subunit [Clostridia bacterium]